MRWCDAGLFWEKSLPALSLHEFELETSVPFLVTKREKHVMKHIILEEQLRFIPGKQSAAK